MLFLCVSYLWARYMRVVKGLITVGVRETHRPEPKGHQRESKEYTRSAGVMMFSGSSR